MRDLDSASTSATKSFAARLNTVILVTTIVVFAAPPVVDLLTSGFRRTFDYLASDAYYYLTVARNIADKGRVSFDGEFATNGFHPCWQFILALLFVVARWLHLGRSTVVYLSLFTEIGLIAAGLYFLVRAVAGRNRALSATFVSLPVGAYGLLILPAWLKDRGGRPPFYGTLWSYVNGMESATAILFFGLTAWWFLGRSPLARARDAFVLGILGALITLSRLDHVFVPAALIAALVLESARSGDRRQLRNVLITIIAFATPIAAYCIINSIYFGSPVPVSGAIKTTFPHIHRPNLDRLIVCLTHFRQQSVHRLYRVGQIAIPLAAAIVCIACEVRPQKRFPYARLRFEPRPLGLFLVACAIGISFTCAYDLLFVELSAQGSWYTPLATLFTSLYVVVAIERTAPMRRLEHHLAGRLAILSIAAALSVVFFVRYQRVVGSGAPYANFYLDEAPRVQRFYESQGQTPRFLEIDDGIFSFATGFSAMPNFCFVGDPECARATRKGLLIPLAVSRGFNRITSVLYVNLGLDPRTPSDAICAELLEPPMRYICPRFRFQVEYRHGSFGVIRVDSR